MKAISAARLMNFRTIFFRVIALACALLFLASGGLTSILAPWGSAGRAFPGFTPEMHRWHSALLGVTEAILLPGLLLALIKQPRERPLLMQFFAIVGVSLVLPHLLTRGSTPISSLFIALPVIAFPALGALKVGARADFVLYRGGVTGGKFDVRRVRHVAKGGALFVKDGRWVGP